MSFTPFTTVTGPAAVLLRANLDTDVILRVERMTSNVPVDLGPFAFEPLRFGPDGREDPSFVLNRAPFRGAPILVAGPNFGCGSSREPAVWALVGLGILCVIAPSFGDIFRANCVQNGVLPVILAPAEGAALAALAETGARVTVDLTTQRITTSPGHVWSFAVPTPQRESLLLGLDDLEITLREAAVVTAWEARDRVARPWAWFAGESGKEQERLR